MFDGKTKLKMLCLTRVKMAESNKISNKGCKLAENIFKLRKAVKNYNIFTVLINHH